MSKHVKFANPYAADQRLSGAMVLPNKVYLLPLSSCVLAGVVAQWTNAIRYIGVAFVVLTAVHSQAIQAAEYRTDKVLVEIHDMRAERNPVKSVRADKLKVSEVLGKIRPSKGQAIAVICEGNFPLRMIANDLYRSNGKLNSEFQISALTTVSDICNQMEDAMRIKNPLLFK